MKKAEQSVHSWLYDNLKGLKEKIIFRDRIEYRVEGKLHNIVGPAYIQTYDPLHKTTPSDTECKQYYIKGIKMDEEQWLINTRKYKIDKLIKKTKKEGNEDE